MFEESLVDAGSVEDVFAGGAMALFRSSIVTQPCLLPPPFFRSLTQLCIDCFCAGRCGVNPWQNPVITSVEAVESCSRPPSFQQSWCVQMFGFTHYERFTMDS